MLEPLIDHTKLLTSKVEPYERLIGGPLNIVYKILKKHKKIGKEYFTWQCLWLQPHKHLHYKNTH